MMYVMPISFDFMVSIWTIDMHSIVYYIANHNQLKKSFNLLALVFATFSFACDAYKDLNIPGITWTDRGHIGGSTHPMNL